MTHPTILASPGAVEPLIQHSFIWPDEAACASLAGQLADALRADPAAARSCFIELHGTLGAGKTTFTRHLLRSLGVQGRIKSPSYAVVEPHEVPGMAIHHFDFYRFNDPQEWEDAGFRDLFASPGLKVAEWPEKARGLLPQPDLRIHIEAQPGEDGGRTTRMEAFSEPGRRWLEALAPAERGGVQAHG